MRLHVLHTNDIHSEFDRYARIAKKLKKLRASLLSNEEAVFVFDLGDHADLSSPVSLATSGRVNARMLGALPYDGWVFGNNETVTIDQHVWLELTQLVKAPLYCSNLHFPGADQSLMGGYIYQLGNLRVGVFGLTIRYEKLFANLGIQADDPEELAWKVALEMRAQGVHAVILLSHLGLRTDKQLAQKGLPVDLIVGSHTHQFLEHGAQVGKTMIVQAGMHAHAFGHATLYFDEDLRIKEVTANLIYLQEADEPDEGVLKIFSEEHEQASVWLNAAIADVDPPLIHNSLGESELVNLLCDQMRHDFAVDVALINGGIITDKLPKGTILRKDLLNVCATPMRVVTMEVGGDLLWRLIDKGLQPEFFKKRGYGFGFRGDTIGQIHLSGATVFVENDHDGSVKQNIIEMYIGDEPIRMDKIYKIATGEFIALSPDIELFQELSFQYQETMLRDLFHRALTVPERIQDARQHRYLVRTIRARG